jgi:ubiquinol-cytochrome c reductase cytochrome c subunit
VKAVFLVAAAVAVGAPLSLARAAAGPAPRQALGEHIYLRDCAICHGADATGTALGPTLIGVGRASVHYYVSTGRMPLLQPARSEAPGRSRVPTPGRFAVEPGRKVARHTSPYSPDEMAALVDYASALVGGPDVSGLDLASGDQAVGGELFRLQCAACHSWAGEGGALLQREAPDLRAATALQAAEAVRVGPGAMPAFGQAALSDDQVADVVAYVRTLQHPSDPGGSALWHLGPVSEGAIAWLVGLGLLVLFVRWIGERA